MLAWLRTGPRDGSTPAMPAKSSHWLQPCRSLTCRSGKRPRSGGLRSGLRPLRSLGLHAGKSSSAQSRVTWRPAAVPSLWRIARSISSRAKSMCCNEALTLRSISGWASAKRPRRWTSHFAAKFGEVLTVSAPPLWLQQPLRAVGDAIERIAHDREIGAAALGDDEPLVLAIE